MLDVEFLVDWNSTDGNYYRAGDKVSLPQAEAFDLRTEGVVDPVDISDPLWVTWEGNGGN